MPFRNGRTPERHETWHQARRLSYCRDFRLRVQTPLDEEHPQRELRLGFDGSMRLLEIVVLIWDDGTETIIHSMKARKQYRALLD